MPSHSGTSPLLRALFAVVLTAVCGSLAGGSPGLSAATSRPTLLERHAALQPGKLLQIILLTNEAHVWQVQLRKMDALRVVVDQQGVDVKVTLTDPIDKQILKVDTPKGDQGSELLHAIAGMQGLHTVRVEAWSPGNPGRYSIRLDLPRTADPKDRLLAEAALRFARGEQLKGRDAASREMALSEYRRVIEILDRVGEDPEREMLAWRQIGQIYDDQGNIPMASLNYQEALAVSKELSDQRWTVDLLNDIAASYLKIPDNESAERASRQAYSMARSHDYRSGELIALEGLAVVDRNRRDTQQALEKFEQELSGWVAEGNRLRQAHALQHIGEIYVELFRLDEGLDHLRRAHRLHQERGDDSARADCLTSIGWTFYLAGNHSLAIRFYREAEALQDKVGNASGKAGTLDRLGTALLAQGRKREALTSYKEALKIFESLGHRGAQASTLGNIAEAYFSLGDAPNALRAGHRALSLYREEQNLEGEAAALLGIAQAEGLLGDMDKALAHAGKAARSMEALREGVERQTLRTSYSASRYDYYEVLIDLWMRLHQGSPGKGYDIQAFNVSERSRARSLLEGLGRAGEDQRAGMDPVVREQERALDEKIAAKEREAAELSMGEGSLNDLARAEEELRSLMLQRDTLQTQIHGSRREPRAGWSSAELAEIQREVLDSETLLLEYSLLPEKSYLWVVSDESIESYELPGREEIEKQARKLYQQLLSNKDNPAGAKKAASALADLVLAPALSRLESRKRLLIVADGALHHIPFQALRVPSPGGGRFDLIDEHEIIDLPSSSVLIALRRKLAGRQPAPDLLAVLADAVFSQDKTAIPADLERAATQAGLTDFVPLKGTREEAEAILRLVPPGEQTLRALGFDATRELVLSGELSRHRYIHIATHGFLNAEYPELSGLVLSLVDERGREVDGFLRGFEIARLDLRSDLVVLSACRTAVGREFRGEGPMGLTRAFLQAGVPSVIVSRWNVSDKGAGPLMERFYENLLQEGLSPGEALREAQLSIKREKKWQDPYYWAVFSLQGEWK